MGKENKSSDADSSELELGSEGGKENVSDLQKDLETPPSEEKAEEEIKKIKELTGKDFKSADDFKKHYENLVQFSGTEEAQEVRKKAELYDKIQKEAGGVLEELDEDQKKEVVEGVDKEVKEDRISGLEGKFEKSEFLRENPDAKEHFGLVEAIADKQKKGFQDAWDNVVKDYAVPKSEKDKEHSTSVETKSRIAPLTTQKINQLVEQISKTDSSDAKEKLVEEFLELSK